MGGVYHGFMLTTAIIISYVMGFFALAFWLIHVIDKSAYKGAKKLLNRKSKSGVSLSDVNRNENPNESTRLIRVILIGFLPVCLIVGDIMALVRFKFVYWPYLIYQLLFYVTLFLICYFVVYRIERRKDWFVSAYLIMGSGVGFLFILSFLVTIEKALPGYTANNELSNYINGPFYPAFVALIICPIVYCFVERYIRKHEYINQLAPRAVPQYDSNPNGDEK